MSRHSPSRRSSFSYTDTPSRRMSTSSDINVFSDDYALEPMDSRLDLTLQDSIQSDHVAGEYDPMRDTANITPYPAIPSRLSVFNRPNSIAKRPLGNDNNPTSHDEPLSRTMSTSSRFSFVRSQSPYSGPTQPSHPYAMYPQITRAASVASASTARPHESPFIPTGGPEHPYSMYQQNTIPTDDDEDIGTQPIPLGFPRLGLDGSTAASSSRGDVGDIVGSDGHIEQLPPYTRYADNVVAKGDMANINDTSTLAPSRRTSQRSTLVAAQTSSEPSDFREHDEQEILLNEEARKEGWKDKAQRRICGGVALWVLILIIASVLFAGLVGGVIGGVVGRKQGASLAASSTTTVWQDADAAETDKNTPPCPTGRYSIPFNQTSEINSCVMNSGLSKSWSCLEIAFLGITISDAYVNGSKILQVSFDDYSVDASQFRYGPQPPDFNGSTFDLTPVMDRDDEDLGVAMYFYKEFNKLSILPEWVIQPQKRSIEERYILERGSQANGHLIQVGESPWFCFWNSTINEFWIYLEKPATPTSSTTLSATMTPAPETDGPVAYSQSSSATISPTTTTSTNWKGVSFGATPTLKQRDAYVSPYLPQYPQLVKMIEKRRPQNNVLPYCQKMSIDEGFEIMPLDQIVFIQESDYATQPLQVGYGDARLARRDEDTVTEQLQSNCVCEWISI